MPIFITEEELTRLSHDPATDEYIRRIYTELDSVAKADTASITAEQTRSLLERELRLLHNYLSLSQDLSLLESKNAKLKSDFEDRLAELTHSREQNLQLRLNRLKSIEKDGEVERLSTEISELRKSSKHLMELLEERNSKIIEKDGEAERLYTEISEQRKSYWRLMEQKDAEINQRNAVRRSDLEAEMSAKLVDVERKYNECSTSLNWHKDRLRELETKITSLQEELSSATTTKDQYNAELSIMNKLVELYKKYLEEWSTKAVELDGVIKAVEEATKGAQEKVSQLLIMDHQRKLRESSLLAKEPDVDESMEATTATDGDKEETEADNTEEKAEESMEAQQENDESPAKRPRLMQNCFSERLQNSVVEEYMEFLNTAPKEVLKTLRGFGEKRATLAVELRDDEPFKQLNDLERIGFSGKQIQIWMENTFRF